MTSAFEFPGRQERPHRAALWILLALSLAHIAATWGHIFLFLGDPGRWLHEVERFAQGEIPYRDYTWSFPPLAVWLLGGIAKIFGSKVHVIWTATSVIFLLIMLGYYKYVAALVQRPLVLPAVIGGFLLSTAYAAQGANPSLPMGMYIPAAPLGFLFLLAAVLLTLRLFVSGSAWSAAGLGFLGALCILTKHDFWIPALYLVVVACGVLLARPAMGGRRLAILVSVTFGLTFLTAISVIGVQAGWNVLPGIVHGFGQIAAFGGAHFPSWERITIQVSALAILALAFGLLLLAGGVVRFMQARRWLVLFLLVALLGCTVHLYMSYRIGLRVRAERLEPLPGPTAEYLKDFVKTDAELLNRSLRLFKARVQRHFFPLFLPIALAFLIAARWRRIPATDLRNTVAFLLGLCVTARLRRSFSYVEWYHFLLEIPLYLLVAELFFPELRAKSQRVLRVALFALVAAGLYSYWFYGSGALTRRGILEKLETPKGTIYVDPIGAKSFRQIANVLAREDPSGERPLFAYMYSGGWNYFLNRRNPTPLTQGFFFSNFEPAKVVAGLLRHDPPAFLLDATYEPDTGASTMEFSLRRWEQSAGPNPYVQFDRPYFEELLAGCKKKVAEVPLAEIGVFTIYDCSAKGER